MFLKPRVVMFEPEELAEEKHLIPFQRGPRRIPWELKAKRLFVYTFSDLVQVFGDWYQKGSPEVFQGVLNIKLSPEDMKRARSNQLSASEILSLNWEDWFIYKINPSEGQHGKEEHSFNYQKTRSS
ncbi:hypothetical protein EDD68_11274 [Melghiribacillus thermohalophilus]|uniref:Uncharacterized protein n=1 Tax=Melghiribacillus thermohalophilus TaxID=1324956 RepID=A0A4R3MZA5_9BACI|nr:hypothetical protein [Melghiribacillus thermohalophilus]TCT20946.1 hypothetical protein EDD68_11274 [Melghiribacillus thermohalophilus]